MSARLDLVRGETELVERLLMELQEFEPECPRPRAQRVLIQSLRDLSGSVSAESMPEMALRLAGTRMGIRLGTRTDDRPLPCCRWVTTA